MSWLEKRNSAISVNTNTQNGKHVDIAITAHGSDFLFAICAVFLALNINSRVKGLTSVSGHGYSRYRHNGSLSYEASNRPHLLLHYCCDQYDCLLGILHNGIKPGSFLYDILTQFKTDECIGMDTDRR